MTIHPGLLLHVSGAEEPQLKAGIRAARNARAQLPDLMMEIVVQLFRGVIVVPAAVAHLATRQLDGWAYIRV